MAPQDTAMEPRPTPRWPRGTCFAWELLLGCRKGPMLDCTGPLLCLEIEESGESDGSWQVRRRGSAGADAGTHSYPIGGAKSMADQPKNHRRIIANVAAIGASKASASPLKVSRSVRRRCLGFMMGTSIRCKSSHGGRHQDHG